MDGAGTSSSTPQMAAAPATWIQLYGGNFAAGWQRVEACRLALFRSADPGNGSATYLGNGILDVPKMLDPALAVPDPAGISGQPGAALAGRQRLVSVSAAVAARGPARQRRGADVRNRGGATRPALHQPGIGRRLPRLCARCRPAAPGSPVCADCSKPSRAFPTPSQRSCERGAYSWLETLAG